MSNKTNIEEDIEFIQKMIKEYRIFGDLDNTDFEDTEKIYKSLENILTDRERLIEMLNNSDADNVKLQKEIEELKEEEYWKRMDR